MFIRYRHNSSSSFGKWQYDEYPYGTDLEDLRNDLEEESWHADQYHQYRGCEVEVIDLPPREWFEKELKFVEKMIEHNIKRRDRYQDVLWKMDMKRNKS